MPSVALMRMADVRNGSSCWSSRGALLLFEERRRRLWYSDREERAGIAVNKMTHQAVVTQIYRSGDEESRGDRTAAPIVLDCCMVHD